MSHILVTNIYISGLDLSDMSHSCISNNFLTCPLRCFTGILVLSETELDFPSPNPVLPSPHFG